MGRIHESFKSFIEFGDGHTVDFPQELGTLILPDNFAQSKQTCINCKKAKTPTSVIAKT